MVGRAFELLADQIARGPATFSPRRVKATLQDAQLLVTQSWPAWQANPHALCWFGNDPDAAKAKQVTEKVARKPR